MKLSTSLLLLVSAACCDASTTGETKASERHAQLRKLQPQSCAEGSSSLVGNGWVPLISLRASVEFSAHICFDEDSGVAVGEFFDSANEDTHVTYHVHCAARDDKGGLYFGTEIEYLSNAVVKELPGPSRDIETTGRNLKKNKATKSPKSSKMMKSTKSGACDCDGCPDPNDCTPDDARPECSPQACDGSGPISCCSACMGRLLEETGLVLQHANGEAKKNRELSSKSNTPPQGTLAILYFGTNEHDGEQERNDAHMFGLHLFADFDHSCELFAEQMKDFSMNEDVAPFTSGGFSIHHF